MGRGIAPIPAGRESHPNWKHWLSASRGRIPDGVTIGSWAPWPISAIAYLIKRSATFCGGMAWRRPKRSQNTTWKEFIRSHMAVLAGIDFFTVEVLTWRGLVTYYVLFFIHLETRRVTIAGITDQPEEGWMQQMARNATLEERGG